MYNTFFNVSVVEIECCTYYCTYSQDWLWKNGTLYNIAASEFSLKNGEKYTFPRYGITAEYNADKDLMEPFDVSNVH